MKGTFASKSIGFMPGSIKRIAALALGLALLNVANSSMISLIARSLEPSSSTSNLPPVLNVFIYAIVSLVLIVVGGRSRALRKNQFFFYLSALLAVAGCFAIFIEHSRFVPLVGFALFSIGSAFLLFYWLELLTGASSQELAITIISVEVIDTIGLFVLNISSSPDFICAAALALALLCMKYSDDIVDAHPAPFDGISPNIDKKSLWKTLVGICFVGLVIGVTQCITLSSGEGGPIYSAIPSIASCLIIICLLASDDTNLSTAEKVVSSLVIITLVLMLSGSFTSQAYLLSSIAFEVMTSVVLYVAVLVAKSGAYAPLRVFGIAEAALSSSSVVILIFVVFGVNVADSTSLLIFTILFALTAIWLINDRNIDLLISPKRIENQEASVEESPFDLKARTIAKSSGLTPRESDVFFLVATGRSAPFIAERLFISENTVKSYMRKVYAKCNVHSRQELISLIESADA